MDWTVIRDAATGRAEAINRVVRHSSSECAALATLLLLEEAPHPAATLVAAATVREDLAAPIQAALAPYVAPALAAWRADPHWAKRAVGDQARWNLPRGVVGMVGALRAAPAALHDAVAIVLRDGDSSNVSLCLNALGADGWAMLNDQQRAALLTRAAADDLGWVWGALTEAQRAATTQRAAANPRDAAALIGRIGATAWQAADPTLREILMNAVLRDPQWIAVTAPAWPGMTDDERAWLIATVMAERDAWSAVRLLDALGTTGRGALTAAQRAALDARAMGGDAWRVLAWRAADAGWTTLSAKERRVVLTAAERDPRRVAVLLRVVGVAGWRAMSADEQARLAAAVRWFLEDALACPPALWADVVGAALPPATTNAWRPRLEWRAEDADADLGALPPAHQALVLARAPWRTEDAAKDAVRVRRLLDAWNALPDDERVALATAHSSVLASVAAAARLRGGASAAVDAIGETVVRVATATDGAAAKRAVAAMLRTPAAWRAWMVGFAPTAADPPGAWAAWIAAARRGVIPDPALCARLAAKEREVSKPARARRRTGR